MNIFSTGKVGSKIIITTRDESVERTMQTFSKLVERRRKEVQHLITSGLTQIIGFQFPSQSLGVDFIQQIINIKDNMLSSSSHSLIVGLVICFSSASFSTISKLINVVLYLFRSKMLSFLLQNKSTKSWEMILSSSTSTADERNASPTRAATMCSFGFNIMLQ